MNKMLYFLLVGFLVFEAVSAFECTVSNTVGPCLALDAFPVLNQIFVNMTLIDQAGRSTNDSTAIDGIKQDFTSTVNSLCTVSQPIVVCVNNQNFSICEQEQEANSTEAAGVLTVYNSFRMLNFGCTLWQSGGANIEDDCQNYQSLFDACASLAPNVYLLRDFTAFFGSGDAAKKLMEMPKISASDCDAFKQRTGCIVQQFTQSCKSPKSADLPWWMARYQLDLSRLPPSICQFTSDDTASKLSEKFRTSPAAAAVQSQLNNNQFQQQNKPSYASTLSPSSLLSQIALIVALAAAKYGQQLS